MVRWLQVMHEGLKGRGMRAYQVVRSLAGADDENPLLPQRRQQLPQTEVSLEVQ